MRISDWSSDVCSSDLDLVHHRHRLRDAEPRAAIFLGHGDAEPTAVGHGAVEIFRKLAAIVAVEQIFIVGGRADGAHALADRVESVLGGKGGGGLAHRASPAAASVRRAAFRWGISYILPSIPSVPASGLAAKAATIARASVHSSSEGLKQRLIVATWSGWIAIRPVKPSRRARRQSASSPVASRKLA